MSKSKHSEAQIIAALEQVEADRSVEDLARSGGGGRWSKQIRETAMIENDVPLGLTVDVIASTSHVVPRLKLKPWLESSGKTRAKQRKRFGIR